MSAWSFLQHHAQTPREGSIGVHGHSTKHATRHFLEAQCAFKVLMIPKTCNSHYVSHFAAFFIDVGTKTSIAESCISLDFCDKGEGEPGARCTTQIPKLALATASRRSLTISSYYWLLCI